MSYVGRVQVDDGDAYPVASTLYGVCSTAADTQTKEVVVEKSSEGESNFNFLLDGVTIRVKFEESNSVISPKLQVGSTTATPIKVYEDTEPGQTAGSSWQAGSVISFTYIQKDNAWYMNDFSTPNVTNHQVLSSATDIAEGKGKAATFSVADNVLTITSGTDATINKENVDVSYVTV